MPASDAGHGLAGALVEASLDAIVCADAAGAIQVWNRAAEALLGYAREEALGMPVERLIPEERREAHGAGMARFLAGDGGTMVGRVAEVEALHRDGTLVPVELSLGAAPAPGGWTFIAVLRDVSRHRQAEDLLRRVALATGPTLGEAFFPALTRNLAKAVGLDLAFVGEIEQETTARLISTWTADGPDDGLVWDLVGAPCEATLHGMVARVDADLGARYPDAAWLARHRAQSLLAVPLRDHERRVVGLLGVAGSAPMDTGALDRLETLLGAFAARAAAEFERRRMERRLREQVDELERLNRLMVGRELRMEALRRELRALREAQE